MDDPILMYRHWVCNSSSGRYLTFVENVYCERSPAYDRVVPEPHRDEFNWLWDRLPGGEAVFLGDGCNHHDLFVYDHEED